uniref:Calcineurin-like phosphoesterase domain-containing protein n=1 Tax=Lotharella globosa TaxID=91324 RepID=A0A7S3YPE1_9EUKA
MADAKQEHGEEAGATAPPPPLRIQIASDIHLEFFKDGLPPLKDIIRPKAPVLALLGDICALGKPEKQPIYCEFLEQCSSHWDVVLVLAGNHEYYSDHNTKTTVEQVNEWLRSTCAKLPKKNTHFLQDSSMVISNVRISGATLWTDIPLSQTVEVAQSPECVEYKLNDFRKCFTSSPDPKFKTKECKATARALAATDTNAWHKRSVTFIKAESEAAAKAKQNHLVLTHHSPTFRNASNKEGDGREYMKYCASTDLEHLFKGVHTWCHGHTHFNGDQVQHTIAEPTRVLGLGLSREEC